VALRSSHELMQFACFPRVCVKGGCVWIIDRFEPINDDAIHNSNTHNNTTTKRTWKWCRSSQPRSDVRSAPFSIGSRQITHGSSRSRSLLPGKAGGCGSRKGKGGSVSQSVSQPVSPRVDNSTHGLALPRFSSPARRFPSLRHAASPAPAAYMHTQTHVLIPRSVRTEQALTRTAEVGGIAPLAGPHGPAPQLAVHRSML
jgi:hypothetical protein